MKFNLIYRSILLVTLASLLLGSCGKPTVPPELTPTLPAKPTSTAQPTATLEADLLAGVDTGSPLAPRVVGQAPDYLEEARLDGSFDIYFDQVMDQDYTTAAFEFSGPDGANVPGSITWPDPRVLRFTPSEQLQAAATYHASLSTGTTAKSGATLPEDQTLDFITVGDFLVSQVTPAPGTIDVSTGAVITVIFNRPVVPLVVVEDQSTLPQPLVITPTVAGVGEWLNTSVYIFRPENGLVGATTYQASVRADLQDAAGVQLADGYSWEFTTLPPSIAGLALPGYYDSPPDGLDNILLDQAFEITFRQPMERESTEAAFSISTNGSASVQGGFIWNDDSTKVTFTPSAYLLPGVTYSLILSTDARAVEGGPLQDGLEWFFTTVRRPEIAGTSPSDGEVQTFYEGSFNIYFASPMKPSSLKGKVTISPDPGSQADWVYSDWNIFIYGLKPSTEYTVTILPGMSDPYGNTIAKTSTIVFTTGAYRPSAYLAMPYTPALFRRGGPQEFYVNTVNTPTVELELYRLPFREYVFFSTNNGGWSNYEPAAVDRIRTWNLATDALDNEVMLTPVTLADEAGNPLEPGMYFVGMEPRSQSNESRWRDARVVVVATANLTLKTTTSEALFWLTDLNTARPIEGIPVRIVDGQNNLLASGTTGRDGLLALDFPANPDDPYATYFAVAGEGEGSEVYAVVEKGWSANVEYYEFGVWSDYYSFSNQPAAYIYTDRPIYRPEQTVHYKGIVRLNDDLHYSLPSASTIGLTISSYEDTVFEGEVPLSENGVFEGSFELAEDATLGSYTISAYFPETRDVTGSFGYVGFNVAEYRKPEFLVEVSASAADILAGEAVTATVSASFYSGGAVPGAEVSWVLSAMDYTFRPEGDPVYQTYSFADAQRDIYYYMDDTYGPESRILAQGLGTTGEDGKLVVSIPTDFSLSTGSQVWTFEATVTDLTGNPVSERVQVTAHQTTLYPGIKAEEYVGLVGQESSFKVIVLDWDSQPQPGVLVNVEIVERRWHNIQEEDAQGRLRWVSSVEEIPVAASEITTGADGSGVVTFTPPNGGVYLARATVTDGGGRQASAADYIWISGGDYIPWRQGNNRNFDLVVDKASYQPGDTAQILIASPFDGEAYALVTVERGHITTQDVVLLETNSTVYELVITPEMAPNTYVSVLVIRGELHSGETTLPPAFKVGMAQINVERVQQELQVEVVPDRTQAAPGEEITYNITTLDYAGNPVRADVSLALVDLSVLALTAPNTIPMLDYFYPHRYLSVMTSVPLIWNIEDYNAQIEATAPSGEGQGSGGGKGGDEYGVIEIRGNFKDTAFWQARIQTDENGQAAVTFFLPDNLTTWRMDARAVTDDTLAGQTTSDIVSTKPLLVRPQTPRFFVVGDKTYLSTAVHNNTGQDLDVTVVLDAQGVSLLDDAAQTISIPNGTQALVGWTAVVSKDAERVDLVFSASGSGFSDASRPPQGMLDNGGIPVYRYEVNETVGTAGSISAAEARVESIGLPVFPGYSITEGEVVLELAPSLAAGMTDGLSYLEHFPYECTEQTVSRFLPNLATVRALRTAGISDPALEDALEGQISLALQRLYSQQHADGGWGWWSDYKSDIQVTAYVVYGLAQARDAGYTVEQSALAQGLQFLTRNLGSLIATEEQYRLNRQAFVLFVLASAGNPDVSATVRMYELRESLAWYARAFLARAIYAIDPQDSRLEAIASDLISGAALSATGAHWEEESRDYWNWNTDTRSTAIVLSALIQIDPENPLNENVVRWLMTNRTEGRWQSTQETAWALMALTDWMAASGELEADYRYQIAVNGEEIGAGSVGPDNLRTTEEIRIAIDSLFTDQVNRLVLARGEGQGTLYYTTHMNVSLPVENIPALERGIIVSRNYYRPDDLLTPVTSAQQGETLLARITVVVPSSLHYLVVEDPLPAGLEAVDESLRTSQQAGYVDPSGWSWEDAWNGWGWWFFNHVELRDEKLVLSVDYLPAGTYEYTYRVRAATPGEYHTIPPTAWEFYFPEVYGRGEGALFEVLP